MSALFAWHDDALDPLDWCDPQPPSIVVADSWRVSDGRTLGLELHRSRFLAGAPNAESFWDAAVATIPHEGEWFPRVELQRVRGGEQLVYREREAPARQSSVVLVTHPADPRTAPGVKGPDLERMAAVRTWAQARGADEAVIRTPEGYVVEGAHSALVWWRGGILCTPPAEFARVPSVTARSLVTLATALGLETHEEAVTPAELDGCEVWSLGALHGIRMVTGWIDGPAVAELPGRWRTWRDRLDALRRELPVSARR